MRGEILVFVHIEAELWNLWVHAVPHDQASALIDQRELQGFRQIVKSFAVQPEVADTSTSFSRRSNWRVRRTATASSMIVPKVDRTDIDLMSERVIELQLSGDICVSSEDPGRQYMGLRFDERLPQNYRHFVVEPTSTDECHPLTAQLRCYMSGADGVTCVRTFDIDFDLEAVNAYLHTEKEVEESILESKSAVLLTEQVRKTANDSASGDAIHVSEKRPKKTPEQQKQPPRPQRDFTPSKDSTKVSANRSRALAFARLTKPMKPPREGLCCFISSSTGAVSIHCRVSTLCSPVHGAPALFLVIYHRTIVSSACLLVFPSSGFSCSDGPPVVLHSRSVTCPSPLCFLDIFLIYVFPFFDFW